MDIGTVLCTRPAGGPRGQKRRKKKEEKKREGERKRGGKGKEGRGGERNYRKQMDGD